MALDRMQVAKECGDDLACYGKTLNDPSWTRAEKAAFALGFSGNAKQALPLAARGDEADHRHGPGPLPGAPGDPFRPGAARHQGLQGVRREARHRRSRATRRPSASRARATCSARRGSPKRSSRTRARATSPPAAAAAATVGGRLRRHARGQRQGREEGRQSRQGRRQEEAAQAFGAGRHQSLGPSAPRFPRARPKPATHSVAGGLFVSWAPPRRGVATARPLAAPPVLRRSPHEDDLNRCRVASARIEGDNRTGWMRTGA